MIMELRSSVIEYYLSLAFLNIIYKQTAAIS